VKQRRKRKGKERTHTLHVQAEVCVLVDGSRDCRKAGQLAVGDVVDEVFGSGGVIAHGEKRGVGI
jgi:hypothetical protein